MWKPNRLFTLHFHSVCCQDFTEDRSRLLTRDLRHTDTSCGNSARTLLHKHLQISKSSLTWVTCMFWKPVWQLFRLPEMWNSRSRDDRIYKNDMILNLAYQAIHSVSLLLFVWCAQLSEKSVLVVGLLPVSVGDLLSDEPSKTWGPPPPSKGGSTVSRRSPSAFLPWESIFRMWVWVLSWAALVSKGHSRRLWRCYMKVSYVDSFMTKWIGIH